MHIGKEIFWIDIKILLLLATTLFLLSPTNDDVITIRYFSHCGIRSRMEQKRKNLFVEKSNHSDKIIDATRHVLNITVSREMNITIWFLYPHHVSIDIKVISTTFFILHA